MTDSSTRNSSGLLRLAWPIFVEQALHMLMGVVDPFMVSHVSDQAVAGLGGANQIVVLFLVVFSFFSIALATSRAQTIPFWTLALIQISEKNGEQHPLIGVSPPRVDVRLPKPKRRDLQGRRRLRSD